MPKIDPSRVRVEPCCPFCGNCDIDEYHGESRCCVCGARARNSYWNRRAMPDCVRALVEECYAQEVELEHKRVAAALTAVREYYGETDNAE